MSSHEHDQADFRQPLQSHRPAERQGGVPGVVVFIGLLLFVNLLSYVFDWPFWVY